MATLVIKPLTESPLGKPIQPGHRLSDLVPPSEVFGSIKTLVDVRDAFLWVDRQHYVIEAWKRLIYESYNDSLIVSRLPREILSKIFRYNVTPFPLVGYSPADWRCAFPSWIGVSHVCRAWRDVALGDPYLWTFPYLNRPKLAREMIRRAQDLPLYLQVLDNHGMASQDWLRDSLSFVFEKKRRIKALDMSMIGDDLKSVYHSLINSDTSCLERASLYDVGQHKKDPPNLVILSPSLQTLRVRDTKPPIPTQPLVHLTSLYISITSSEIRKRNPDLCFTPTSLVHFLEGAPRLEQVEIYHALRAQERSYESPSTGSVRMTLPNLSSLIIRDSPDLTVQFLRWMDMPTLCQLKLYNVSSNSKYADHTDFFSTLERLISDSSHPDTSKPNHLEFIWDPEKAYDSLLFSVTTTEGQPLPSSQMHIKIQTPLQGEGHSLFRSRFPNMKCANNGLRIWSDQYQSKKRVQLGSDLFNISHLYVERRSVALNTLIKVLQKKDGVDEYQGYGEDFSQIKLIQINDADVTGGILKRLGEILQDRLSAGILHPKLRFSSCRVSRADIKQLERLIPEIVVEIL